MAVATKREPILAGPDEIESIERVERVLGASPAAEPTKLIGPGGEQLDLPAALHAVLTQATHALSAGHGVAVVPTDVYLTTQQAAVLLDTSRPSIIKLLDAGRLPYHRVRTHRRIRLDDVLAYRQEREDAAEAAMRRLVERAQDLGVYDEHLPVATR